MLETDVVSRAIEKTRSAALSQIDPKHSEDSVLETVMGRSRLTKLGKCFQKIGSDWVRRSR